MLIRPVWNVVFVRSTRRVRYGYRRVHVLLEREGWGTNIKRTYRIYRDGGLQLRNKTPERRVKAKLREATNDCWTK